MDIKVKGQDNSTIILPYNREFSILPNRKTRVNVADFKQRPAYYIRLDNRLAKHTNFNGDIGHINDKSLQEWSEYYAQKSIDNASKTTVSGKKSDPNPSGRTNTVRTGGSKSGTNTAGGK